MGRPDWSEAKGTVAVAMNAHGAGRADIRGTNHLTSPAVRAESLRVYRRCMEYLRGPLYLDIAAKGLCLAGVGLMIFGQGGWFIVGIFAVFIGVLIGAWAMLAARRTRPPDGRSGPAPFGARTRRDGPAEEGGNP